VVPQKLQLSFQQVGRLWGFSFGAFPRSSCIVPCPAVLFLSQSSPSVFLTPPHKLPRSNRSWTSQSLCRTARISKQFTLDVANAMPPELHTLSSRSEEMTFGEQIVHIAGANAFRFAQITGGKAPFEFHPAKMSTDKQSATKLLEDSFDYVISVLPGIRTEQRKTHLAYSVTEGANGSRRESNGREYVRAHGSSARTV
jgi:hypothetical protein